MLKSRLLKHIQKEKMQRERRTTAEDERPFKCTVYSTDEQVGDLDQSDTIQRFSQEQGWQMVRLTEDSEDTIRVENFGFHPYRPGQVRLGDATRWPTVGKGLRSVQYKTRFPNFPINHAMTAFHQFEDATSLQDFKRACTFVTKTWNLREWALLVDGQHVPITLAELRNQIAEIQRLSLAARVAKAVGLEHAETSKHCAELIARLPNFFGLKELAEKNLEPLTR